MGKEIRWTDDAIASYYEILDYLKIHWTEKELTAFIDETEEVLHYISLQPLMFRRSSKGFHEALVLKQNLLIYRVKPHYIELLLFWDTRQHPRKKFKKR